MKRQCIAQGCTTLTDGSRCPLHRKAQRAKYSGGWQAHSKAAIAYHVQTVGWWCPGWAHPAHESHDLTLDHGPPEMVLCRSCNSRKRNLGDG